MYFSTTLLVGASFVVAAWAQNKIAFTQVPSSVTAGDPTTLKWGGGDGTSLVTIELKKGNPDNLQTISVLTGDATGNSYTWTPAKTLVDGTDYALQISQGVDDINYSGQFPLTGGAASATSTGLLTSSSTAASASSTITSQPKLPVPIIPATASKSISALLSSLNGTLSSILSNSSVAIVTTTVGTAASSGGTGIPMARNTTMSSATLSSPSATGGGVIVGGSSTGTSGSSSAASSTSSSAPASSTSAKSSASVVDSPLALVLSAMVAILYMS
ncbi:hypothetical protein MMC06_001796 [Schaereria dolodes]|nr:hypothetical protein [Schaereria dolodes]